VSLTFEPSTVLSGFPHCGPIATELLSFEAIIKGIRMQRWAIAILFSTFFIFPSASDISDGTVNCEISLPIVDVQIGSDPHSNGDVSKKSDGDAKMKEKNEKELRDRKVDDAIKKALEEK
jgi:hypothetical protein